MFYMKAEIAPGITIKAQIIDENIFTICPQCGAEHNANLQDAVVDGQLDLYGTAIYCDTCSEAHLHPKKLIGGRVLHFEKWQPSEKEYRRLLAYFKDYYEGTRDNCGVDDDLTAEALELYKKVQRMPLRCIKDDIQAHFADMFRCVDGMPEKYYDNNPEIIDLINLTVAPDPLEG